MSNQTLLFFVKECIERGESREDITRVLEKAGWKSAEVQTALNSFSDVPFSIAVPKPKQYLSAREAFLYLFYFILLGIAAFSLGGLLFDLIDLMMPNEDQTNYRSSYLYNSIRTSIAGLIVSVPLFGTLAVLIMLGRRKNPEMQRSRIRKWLTYLTLVVAGCTIVGDLISVFSSFLNGELTPRFLLKALALGAIAGGIFGYFIQDAERGDENDQAS